MDLFILFFVSLFQLQSPALTVTSPDFVHDGEIPLKFSCDGEDINPALNINGIPEGTQTLVLIVEDPDVSLTRFNHWIVWNIPPQQTIAQNSIPGIQGTNTLGKNKYMGPCPPVGTHRYFFKVYALGTALQLPADTNRQRLESAMKGNILATGEIMGRYNRQFTLSSEK